MSTETSVRAVVPHDTFLETDQLMKPHELSINRDHVAPDTSDDDEDRFVNRLHHTYY